jgi:hypothetical protein
MQVQECYEVSADYEGKGDTTKLGELGAKLTGLAPADAILVASSILHMLNLANVAEEVQIAHRPVADPTQILSGGPNMNGGLNEVLLINKPL